LVASSIIIGVDTMVDPTNCFPLILPAFFHCSNKPVIKIMVWFPFATSHLPFIITDSNPKRSQWDQFQQRCIWWFYPLKPMPWPMLLVPLDLEISVGEVSIWNSLFFNNMHIGITCDKVSEQSVMEVPCKETNTTFKFSFAAAGVLKLAFSIDDL
jgi:hypothetical protein